MAKLEKYRFAELLNWLGARTRYEFEQQDIVDIDNMIEIIEPAKEIKASRADIDELLSFFSDAGEFINAVRCYRNLTGSSLIDSKNAIEAFRKRIKFKD